MARLAAPLGERATLQPSTGQAFDRWSDGAGRQLGLDLSEQSSSPRHHRDQPRELEQLVLKAVGDCQLRTAKGSCRQHLIC